MIYYDYLLLFDFESALTLTPKPYTETREMIDLASTSNAKLN
jgi:hypothetical protein